MRIAHRMVNHQIRKLIAESVFTTVKYALENQWIASFLLFDNSRTHSSQNRLP